MDHINSNNLSEFLADIQEMKWEIFEEISQTGEDGVSSLTTHAHGYWYYTVTDPETPYPRFCRSPKTTSKFKRRKLEEVTILDLNTEFAKWGVGQLGVNSISPSGRYLAYSLDTAGNELFTLQIKDIETGDIVCPKAVDTKAGGTWINDQEFLFIGANATGRRSKIQLLNTRSNGEPTTLYYEYDSRFSVDVGRTRSGKFVLLEAASATTSEYWYLDIHSKSRKFELYEARAEGVFYQLDHVVINGVDHWVYYIPDSENGPAIYIHPIAKDYANTPLEIWRARAGCRIKKLHVYEQFIVVEVSEAGGSRILRFECNSEQKPIAKFRSIKSFDASQKVELFSKCDWDTTQVDYLVESYFSPPVVERIDLNTFQSCLIQGSNKSIKENLGQYNAKTTVYESHDGVEIPVTILWNSHKRDNTKKPLFLYVYGAYGTVIEAGFSTSRLSLLDRGVVFAIAHVRGGGELGKHWHNAGRKLQKRNSFLDCISVIDGLIKEEWTTPGQIIIRGDSAGALIPSVLMNECPEYLLGIQMISPFLDPLSELKNQQSYLASREVDEWGDVSDPEIEDYIRSYSPIENLNDRVDCNVFLRISPNDPRVNYRCAMNWVSLVNERRNGCTVVVSDDKSFGHSGALNQIEIWENIAEEISWCLKLWDIGNSGQTFD